MPTGPGAAGYAFEFKWDGVRAVTGVGGDQVQVISRNGNDVTRSYPELGVLTGLVDVPVVLDGEIVALDDAGRARFDLLQYRMHLQQTSSTLLGQVPVTYVLFDLLHLDGPALVDQPYQRRRELLDGLDLDGRSPRVRVPRYHLDVDGDQLLAVARAHHLEGVVAKIVPPCWSEQVHLGPRALGADGDRPQPPLDASVTMRREGVPGRIVADADSHRVTVPSGLIWLNRR